MAQNNDSGLRTAPSFELKIGGQAYTQADPKGFQSMVIEDHMDMVDMLTAEFGGAPSNPPWNFKIGDAVEAKAGAGSNLLFKGNITAIEPSFPGEGITSIRIRALDPVSKLGRGRRTRFWENVKDSDIVKEVGAECGLSVKADPTDQTRAYVLQRNESNVAFLKRLAAQNNFTLRVEESTLEFKKTQYSGQDVGVEMGKNLSGVRMNFNSSEMVSKVEVRGWDIMAKKEVVGTASSSDVTSVGGGTMGVSNASSAFGDSVAYITDVPVSTQEAANQIAKAEMERIARQFAKGSANMKGNDQVRAGARVQLKGLSAPQDGTYFIVSSKHTVNANSGYTTEFTFCSNTFGS
jgi:phage protein D